MSHEPMPPKPDLETHSTIRFLDRFVQRNAKKSAGLHGDSIFQPLAAPDSSHLLISARPQFGAVNSSDLAKDWKMDAGEGDAIGAAFHKYYAIRNKGKDTAQKKKEKKKLGSGDSDDEDNDDNEEEIWKALVDSRPDIEGSDLEDSDLDMIDLESEMGDSDGDPIGAVSEDEDVESDNFDGFDEDDADVFGSDEEIPSDLDAAFAKELEMASQPTEVKDRKGEKRSERKKRLKNLPTFASVEDYATILEDEEEEAYV